MAEHPFEFDAARLFAVAPAFDDSAAFAQAVDARLARYSRVRGWALGLAGATGLIIALRAVASSDWAQRASSWAAVVGDQATRVDMGAASIAPQMWVWVALAVCAAGLGAGGLIQRN